MQKLGGKFKMRVIYLLIGIVHLILGSFLAYTHFSNFLSFWAMINGFLFLWLYDYILNSKINENKTKLTRR
jgi:hypothetical protein